MYLHFKDFINTKVKQHKPIVVLYIKTNIYPNTCICVFVGNNTLFMFFLVHILFDDAFKNGILNEYVTMFAKVIDEATR